MVTYQALFNDKVPWSPVIVFLLMYLLQCSLFLQNKKLCSIYSPVIIKNFKYSACVN